MKAHPAVLTELPLSGLNLIEASAGTGKTYTLAGLYLRQLLQAPREVGEILVVTFTEAATAELRDRIRARLLEARTAFQMGASEDALLRGLLDAVPDHAGALRRLNDALLGMDDAAIFTIHGFCYRVLVELAFESGMPFESELLADESELQRSVIADFWRRFYSTERGYAQWLLTQWSDPQALFGSVQAYLKHPDLRVQPAPDPALIRDLSRRFEALHGALAQAWTQQAEEMLGLLAESTVLARGPYKRDQLWQRKSQWDAYFNAAPTPVLPEKFELLSPQTLLAKRTAKPKDKDLAPPSHPLLDACAELSECARALSQQWRIALMHEVLQYLRAELRDRKQARGQIAYDDMLTRLESALTAAGGAALAQRLVSRFPIAMIDEFQDTDPVQYRIFRTLYYDQPDTALYLIGDPKQAIYQFRGADVFTYIQARRDLGPLGAHFTLNVNHRSAARLVDAVNAVFDVSIAPFIFEPEISFQPVQAAGRADQEPLRVEGEAPAPLQVWLLERPEQAQGKPIGKGEAMRRMSQACAEAVRHLLAQARAGKAMLGTRALAAQDIAILVRAYDEADEIRRALAACGIACVYYSRESVFRTPEAQELEQVLQAVAEPLDEGLLRTALATRLLGWDAVMLDREAIDEQTWEELVERFQAYHQRWQSEGVLPMLQNLLLQEGVLRRLQSQPDSERRLTNLLHLGELLQTVSPAHDGIPGLLHWLHEQRQDEREAAEDRQLRLESDEALVKIVTIHKSKGLEYPVVFLPYLWRTRKPQAKQDTKPVLYHDQQDLRLVLDLGSAQLPQHEAMAAQEQLAEDLRLLYVALTRAKHRCYVGWGVIKDAEQSALAYLLYADERAALDSAGKDLSDAMVRAAWQRLAERAPGCIAIGPPPSASSGTVRLPQPPRPQGSARHFSGRVTQGWSLTSYSQLTAAHTQPDLPDHDAIEMGQPAPAAPAGTPFSFPRGARTGNLLHQLLETLDFKAQPAELQQAAAAALAEYGHAPEWQLVLVQWLQAILMTPLDEAGSLRLQTIDSTRRLSELAFYFPINALDIRQLMQTLDRHGHPQLNLPNRRLTGMMKGYIDLVFEQEGRYYLADYKTNYLGATPADYLPAQLESAMRANHYDLQYLIYTVALHRHLRNRLPDYDYTRDFGGVYYLFLRGMNPAHEAGCGIFFEQPAQALILALDTLFAGGGGHA